MEHEDRDRALPLQFYAVVFTPRSWQLFLDAGASVAGFRQRRLGQVARIRAHDVLLPYLSGAGLLVGELEATGECYVTDDESIWGTNLFPVRLPVRATLVLPADRALPVQDLIHDVPLLQRLASKHPGAWGAAFRGSPRRWDTEDGVRAVKAIRGAAGRREQVAPGP